MADFSQSGSDGVLPPGASEWRRGLVYTAKPAIPSTLQFGQEYRIMAGCKQKNSGGRTFTGYAELYRRVTALANARVAQLRCSREEHPINTWLLCHGWRTLGDTHNIAAAFLTMGLICQAPGVASPTGESAPTGEQLSAPGGATLETLTRFAPRRVDEIYSEFDFTDPSGTANDPVMLSYGESIPRSEATDFLPSVQRAEKLARFYYDVLQAWPGSPPGEPFRIIRREWYRVTNTDLITVQVHFNA